MANAYKVLGQVLPPSSTNTNLYTAASNVSTIISTLTVCNQSTSGTTVRLAVRPAGAAIEAKHYLVFDTFVAANDTLFLTIGISLAPTDVITVYSGNATTSFHLYGTEVS